MHCSSFRVVPAMVEAGLRRVVVVRVAGAVYILIYASMRLPCDRRMIEIRRSWCLVITSPQLLLSFPPNLSSSKLYVMDPCAACGGTGKTDCTACDGTGKNGRWVCSICGGKKKRTCSTCDGSGQTGYTSLPPSSHQHPDACQMTEIRSQWTKSVKAYLEPPLCSIPFF